MITFILTVILITADGPRIVDVERFTGSSAYQACSESKAVALAELRLAGEQFDALGNPINHVISCRSPQAR